MKIFWLFNHPAPYKVNLFNLLGKKAEVEAYFERSSEKGRNALFYSETPISFSAHFCKGISWGEMDNYSRDPIKALKKNRYDVIVLNGWRTLTEQRTIAYCKRNKLPYVFLINGGIVKEKELGLLKAIKTHFISGASAYLSPDEKSKQYLVHYGAEDSRVFYYPYSSIFEKELQEKPLSKEGKQALRKELGLQGEKVFLSAGQLIPRKNYAPLIRFWKSRPQGESLYILGDGEQKEELLLLIKELGLTNVFLLPHKPHDEVLKYFSAGDCFLFPSKEDIYGHVINEALSQGVPVISSPNVNAALHLIKDGRNGFLDSFEKEGELGEKLSCFPDQRMEEEALRTARGFTMETSAEFLYLFFKERCQ